MVDITVIILTYNEEANIAQALDSIAGWANEIFILDSQSTDRTLEIARQYGCHIAQNNFENYAKQRNYALDHLPISSEWVLFLDADEWLSEELKKEILTLLVTAPEQNGFYIKRRLIWMGRWIRRGYYPSWQLRLFRNGKGRCEDRAVNEHLIVEGITGHLLNDFTDENKKGVSDWIAKHNGYATREAQELLSMRTAQDYQEIDARLFGTQAQRRRWLRYKVWNNLPPLIRPFFYFIYRYILLGGFLDRREAFIFHFLQALWYPLLIDVKYLELKMARSRNEKNPH
ncbi:glycosyltransferase family 2 protein [Sulfuriflexus mobilis]|uniref:glycosyltransferase family 2 protein n=1 Tax=Sulfuriflexus mobilis TaxID=1811807 RepID=UPI000F842D75|nr:glycosyltransferase family 2 protein [Sulfuriflexus mobilis]